MVYFWLFNPPPPTVTEAPVDTPIPKLGWDQNGHIFTWLWCGTRYWNTGGYMGTSQSLRHQKNQSVGLIITNVLLVVVKRGDSLISGVWVSPRFSIQRLIGWNTYKNKKNGTEHWSSYSVITQLWDFLYNQMCNYWQPTRLWLCFLNNM